MPEALFMVFLSDSKGANLCKSYRSASRQELSNEWSDHCTKKHPVDGPAIENDEGADRPGRRTVEAGDAASRKEAAKTAAPGHRQKAPSGDKGTQKTKKASVAPKEK